MEKELPELNKQSPDDVLMLHIQQRSSFAFELLYERYRLNITAFVRRMLGNEESAKDAVQETFMRVITKRDTYVKGKRVGPWIFRIASNICVDELRKNKFKAVADESEIENLKAPPSSGPAAQAERAELERAVKNAFSKLGPQHRAMVIMQKYVGMNYNDIADALDKKPSWIKWHMKLAYDVLAKELKIYSSPSCTDHDRK